MVTTCIQGPEGRHRRETSLMVHVEDEDAHTLRAILNKGRRAVSCSAQGVRWVLGSASAGSC
jgi:hypothetical protein